jgi:hypothetical protein
MGGNLSALPALDVRPPATPPNPLAEFGQVAAIQRSQQQQQIQQQEIQKNQQALTDNQAVTKAMQDWDPSTGDYNALTQAALRNGASATAATALQQHGLQVTQLAATLDETKRKAFAEKRKALADDLQPLTDPSIVPDDQLQSEALNHITRQVQAGNLSMPEAQPLLAGVQQTNDPTTLRNLIMQKTKTDLGMAGIMAQQKETAQSAEATQKARESAATATIKEIEAKGLQGITPDYINQTAQDPITKQQALASLMRGDVQGAKDALKAGFESALGTQKEVSLATNPAVQDAKARLAAREKQADQIITQGDPDAAGKLLADGSLTLSELKSRGTTPQFIVQATNAAKNYDPKYSPQAAEGQLAVAKSPANVAFFGSAKSLTDKGGTLDQLEAAAKDIPDGQIPVFNSLADAYKAATGSGPVAKYASILTGVADDYSKVMGGGTGSDSSRMQAIKLAPTNASPEARHAAVEGIRGSVSSQINSRIGNNAVLRKMYGDFLPQQGSQPQNTDFFTQFGGKAH